MCRGALDTNTDNIAASVRQLIGILADGQLHLKPNSSEWSRETHHTASSPQLFDPCNTQLSTLSSLLQHSERQTFMLFRRWHVMTLVILFYLYWNTWTTITVCCQQTFMIPGYVCIQMIFHINRTWLWWWLAVGLSKSLHQRRNELVSFTVTYQTYSWSQVKAAVRRCHSQPVWPLALGWRGACPQQFARSRFKVQCVVASPGSYRKWEDETLKHI